jgi:hypothetical protein
MDRSQYEALCAFKSATPHNILIDASAYSTRPHGNPRTLLYGYTCDRETHHVFQDDMGGIRLYVYRNNFGTPETPVRMVDVSNEGVATLDELIPNKRLYPQHCDHDFCLYLKERGVHLPFTTWEEPRTGGDQPDSPFRGQTY